MDMQSQMTRPYGHDQAEDPIKIHHPEEEEHQEKGATKVLKKVKEKAKKIKNSLTKHGHGHDHDHDMDEEGDEYDEQDPEVHGAPVYESSAVRGGVTGQPEDEYLGGQRKVKFERPKGLEEDPAVPGGGSDYLSGASNYQSKVTDPTQKRGGETGVPGITESLSRMKVTDESHDPKSGPGFERDSPIRSHEFGLKNESGIDKNSPTGLGSGSIAVLGGDFPVRSHELGLKSESRVGNDSLSGFTGESGTRLGEDFPPRGSHEIGVKDSGIGKDSPRGSHGYGEESEVGLEKKIPARNDDVKVETVLGRDLPTGNHDQFSPELSCPKERGDIDSKAEEMKDETQEPKPSTYKGKIASATSAITDKAIAAKNAVASRLGYSGETTGAGGKHDSPVVDETPTSATGYGQKVVGTVAEKLTPVYEKVKETGSTVMTKLPLSGGVRGAEETHQGEDKGVSTRDYLAEKLTPGEEDKALSEVIAEKLHLRGGEKKTTTTKEVEVTVEKIPSDQISEEREHGETVAEEMKGGGMVGKIKGWFGGKTEEMKPKSSDSVEEPSQSLGSTVGTKGFSDSGGGGAVPVRRGGLQESGN